MSAPVLLIVGKLRSIKIEAYNAGSATRCSAEGTLG